MEEDGILDVAARAYIESRVQIMCPTSKLWEMPELDNIKPVFESWWPRLEAIFRNRNMALCFLTNHGVLLEHGIFYDENGTVNHVCCTTDVTTGMAAKEVDPADPAYGYTAACDSEAGAVTVKSNFIKYIREGP